MTLRTKVTTIINRPPEAVFAVLADLAHHGDWAKGPTNLQGLSRGPANLGTTWANRCSLAGKEFDMHARVHVYEAGRTIGFELDKPFPARRLYLVEAADGGTQVTFSTEAEPGDFFGVSARLLTRAMKDVMSSDLRSLKAVLEATA